MTGTQLATRTTEAERNSGLELPQVIPPVAWMTRIEEHPHWETLARLRLTLRAGVKVNHFRVRDLLGMKEGQIFETLSPYMEDVPVRVGQMQLGWSEFEVLEQRMALRLTRLG